MATIKDVARLAEVSPGTVTRYFENKPLKESNRKKIEEAISQLEYTVNPIARSLRSKKSYTIGVLASHLNERFTTGIVAAAERYFLEYGYSLIICSSDGQAELERKRLHFLMKKKIDGLILFSTLHNSDLLKSMIGEGIPVVSLDTYLEDVPCDAVLADNINGTYAVMEHLFAAGHQRIGIVIGSVQYLTAKERLEGYTRALRDYKIEADEQLVYAMDYSVKTGYDAMDYFAGLKNPPTAVIATNYDTSLGAVMYANKHNISIPDDLSLVAFDFQELNEIVKPSISVAVQPVDEMGAMAAKTLFERLNKQTDAAPKVCRLKFSFISGQSVKPL